jgi:putative membrane protein
MTRLLLAASASALLLAACGDNRADQDPVNAVQDAASVPVGQMSAATLGANTPDAYVANAAMGDMYEIRAAELALERSHNAEVRELAEMIRTDHTQASEALRQAASQAAADVELPAELDERRQGLLDNLRAATGAAFDQVYVDQQVAAHREAVTLHEGFADNTDVPQLAQHAAMVLPKIRMHLERAEALDDASDATR